MVYYLKYVPHLQSSVNNGTTFNAIYFNYRFGASSLSWLPSLTSITHKLNAKVSLAHDAVRFGLTQRPYITKDQSSKKGRKRSNVIQYTFTVSATIGTALLSSYSSISDKKKESSISSVTPIEETLISSSSVTLFGHSMGCITTLHMALELPKTMEKEIFLVAPTLFPTANVPSALVSLKRKLSSFPMKFFSVYKFLAIVKYLFIDVPFKYVLKRLVRYV